MGGGGSAATGQVVNGGVTSAAGSGGNAASAVNAGSSAGASVGSSNVSSSGGRSAASGGGAFVMQGGGGTAGSATGVGGTVGSSGGVSPEAGGTASASGGANATAGAAGSGGQGPTTYPALTAAQIGAPVRVAGGYGLAESPMWDPCGQRLLFSDVQGDSGRGVIHALAKDGTVTDFMTNTGNTNGFAFDIDGSLILTQMGGRPGKVSRRDKSGMVRQISPAGAPLHTPDDVVVRSDGTIYFTDGDFCPIGNLLGYATRLPVYLIRPGSTALVNSGTVSGPNGIELSPDEQTLYVNGFGEGDVWSFSVAADGALTKNPTPVASGLTNPDSLCLDAAGNLYVAVSTGVQVLRPDGKKIKLISIATSVTSCSVSGTTNCSFGGDDGKTLYITNWTTLFKVEGMPIPGLDWVVNSKRVKCN
jgi:gluconolactonase